MSDDGDDGDGEEAWRRKVCPKSPERRLNCSKSFRPILQGIEKIMKNNQPKSRRPGTRPRWRQRIDEAFWPQTSS